MKKIKRTILIFFTMLCTIIIVGCGDETSTSSQYLKDSDEYKLDLAIHKYLDDNTVLCKLQDIEINTLSNDECVVVVNLKGKPGATKDSTLSDFNTSAKYVFKAVYTAEIPLKIKNCKVIINADLTDSRTGENKEEGIYACALDNAHANKINWENVSKVDITLSLNDVYMHQAMVKF